MQIKQRRGQQSPAPSPASYDSYFHSPRRRRGGQGRRPLVLNPAGADATPYGAKSDGGYMTIETRALHPPGDRGSGDIGGKVEVHEMTMNNGVMTIVSSTRA